MKTILRSFICVCLIILCFSCKKGVDKLKENYVLGVLTDGRWFLDNYTLNDVDVTSNFSEYEFKFYENGKMDAITNSSVVSGTWSGDVTNLTFTVTLPASDPKLVRLNYVWQWLKSNIGVVFAENVTPAQKISIRLKKK